MEFINSVQLNISKGKIPYKCLTLCFGFDKQYFQVYTTKGRRIFSDPSDAVDCSSCSSETARDVFSRAGARLSVVMCWTHSRITVRSVVLMVNLPARQYAT